MKTTLLALVLMLPLAGCAEYGLTAKQDVATTWAMANAMVDAAQAAGVLLVDADDDLLESISAACLLGTFGTSFAAQTFEATDENVQYVIDTAPVHLRGACTLAMNILEKPEDA